MPYLFGGCRGKGIGAIELKEGDAELTLDLPTLNKIVIRGMTLEGRARKKAVKQAEFVRRSGLSEIYGIRGMGPYRVTQNVAGFRLIASAVTIKAIHTQIISDCMTWWQCRLQDSYRTIPDDGLLERLKKFMLPPENDLMPEATVQVALSTAMSYQKGTFSDGAFVVSAFSKLITDMILYKMDFANLIGQYQRLQTLGYDDPELTPLVFEGSTNFYKINEAIGKLNKMLAHFSEQTMTLFPDFHADVMSEHGSSEIPVFYTRLRCAVLNLELPESPGCAL